jgi:hypothetical protein
VGVLAGEGRVSAGDGCDVHTGGAHCPELTNWVQCSIATGCRRLVGPTHRSIRCSVLFCHSLPLHAQRVPIGTRLDSNNIMSCLLMDM